MSHFTARHRAYAIAALASTFAACEAKPKVDAPATEAATSTDSAVTVTAAQRGQILTVKIEQKSFNPTILTTGTVSFNGDKSTQVISAISGPVIKLLVQLGDSVKSGEALATVASPDFASAVAGYRKAESALTNAKRIEALDEKLFAGDALSKADLDQAKSDLASAEADREAASQQLAALGVDSSSVDAIRQGKTVPGGASVIRSPINGIVVERLITQGQLLQAGGTPTFTIADLSSVWVMGNVFEADAGSVFKGETAISRIEGSTDSFPGHIDYIGAMVNPDSKAMAVRIDVPNPQDRLKQNMLVQLEIRGAHAHAAIVIPASSVLRDEDNLPFVFVDGGNNKFLRRRIALGGRTGDVYEVATGLKSGESVVTQGALLLQEAGSQ